MKKKMAIAYVMIFAGLFLVLISNMIPSKPSDTSDGILICGAICELIGGVIAIKEGVKYKKSRKKDDEETKKW